jgi:DNA modification methylase
VSDYQLFHGDCLEVMAGMEDNSIDSIVCDPPAGISFMGKKWDGDKGGRNAWIAWMASIAAECLRVLKPGGHAFVWALPRTSHWTATAWEDAGFEVRDRVAHVFGSGFPKSLDVSKAIDKAAGAEREVVGVREDFAARAPKNNFDQFSATNPSENGINTRSFAQKMGQLTAPATPAAQQWDGWGTALKPAMEDWWLFRKPLAERTVAANVLEWGTGAINVDGCRVGTDDNMARPASNGRHMEDRPWVHRRQAAGLPSRPETTDTGKGRWPANLILSYPEDEYDDEGNLLPNPGKDEVLAGFPVTTSGALNAGHKQGAGSFGKIGGETILRDYGGDTGSAARFFYVAKSSKRDRNEGLDGTCTVKYNIDKSNLILSGGLSWKNVYAGLVQSLQKATSGIQTVKWLIDESGESITGLCPLDSLSTTLTEISRITTSEILNLLTPSLTSAFIPAVNSEMANGGNPAESAENSSKYQQTTTNGSQESARGASLVVSKMLSVIRDGENWKHKTNIHSTVKPTALMQYLCRLITPPGGLILDPFAGSGSTGKGAILEGFRFIGIEQDAEYIEIARRRIEWAFQQAHPTTGEFVTKAGRADDLDGLPMFGGEQ